jgi:hypothetical protein
MIFVYLLEFSLFLSAALTSTHFYWMSLVSWIIFRLSLSFNYGGPTISHGTWLISPAFLSKSIWYIMCVIFPLYISIFPPAQFPLPNLPGAFYVNKAIALITASYLLSTFGRSIAISIYHPKEFSRRRLRSIDDLNFRGRLALKRNYLFLGLIGMVMLLKAASSVDTAFFSFLVGGRSWIKFFAIVLPPLLVHAAVLHSSTEDLIKSKRSNVYRFLILTIAVLPLTLFRLNRAAIFIPIFCFLVITVPNRSKIKFVASWLVIGIIGGTLVFTVADYRARKIVTQGGRYSESTIGYRPNPGVLVSIQNYLNSPQYLGYALEEIPAESISFITPVKSLAAPLPKLSKFDSDRTDGTSVFNLSIYHRAIYDQVLSCIVEIWLAYGFIGLFLLFFFQGILIELLERKFRVAISAYRKYFLLYCGFWVALLPSISVIVVSQIFFYNILLPLLISRLYLSNTRYSASKKELVAL